jgi:hypothetical protein
MKARQGNEMEFWLAPTPPQLRRSNLDEMSIDELKQENAALRGEIERLEEKRLDDMRELIAKREIAKDLRVEQMSAQRFRERVWKLESQLEKAGVAS